MPDVLGIVLRVAFVNDLEERLLHLRYAFAGFDVGIHGFLTEFAPEILIREQLGGFFTRQSGAFGAAERVVHHPVQVRKRREPFPHSVPGFESPTRHAQRGP